MTQKANRTIQVRDNKHNIKLARLQVENARRTHVIEADQNPKTGAYVESNMNAFIGALKSTTIIWKNTSAVANRSARNEKNTNGSAGVDLVRRMNHCLSLATVAAMARITNGDKGSSVLASAAAGCVAGLNVNGVEAHSIRKRHEVANSGAEHCSDNNVVYDINSVEYKYLGEGFRTIEYQFAATLFSCPRRFWVS